MKEEIINHCSDDLVSLSEIYEEIKYLVEVFEKRREKLIILTLLSSLRF
jgi:hypothetical protein